MADILVPIDKAGRIVLPKNVREELAISPGDTFQVLIRGSEVTLRPKKTTSGFLRKGQALVFSSGEGDRLDRETVEAVLADGRSEQTVGVASRLPSRKHKQ